MVRQALGAGSDVDLPEKALIGEALIEAAFASSALGIYLTDRAGRMTAVNPQAAAMLARPAATMVGANAHDLLHRDPGGALIPRSSCQQMAVLESGTAARSERSTFLRGNGTLLPVAWWAAPLRRGDRVLGVVVVFDDITERLTLSRRQADQIAALENFTARLTLVTEVTSVLTQTLEVDEALQRLGRLIVPRLTDWAAVDLRLDHEEVHRVVVVPPPGIEVRPDWLGPLPVVGAPSHAPLTRVLDRGETVLLSPDDIAAVAGSPEAAAQRELFAALGAVSVIITPLRTPRQVLGALTVARTDPANPFDATDVTLVADIGRRAGLAVDNARLFGQQREVAETMQRHLLAPLPEVGHLRMAARYLPAPVGSQVGGDWYDAFALPDGVTALVIGDVVGHDVKAAADMAQLRSMVRTLAWDRCESPGQVIERLDQAMSAVTDVSMATMIFARIERPEGGPWRLRWSTAGHPPPLLVTPDGQTRYLEQEQDSLLGLRMPPVASRHDGDVPIPADSTLLLYTDGLVESPRSDLGSGMARLRRHAAGMAGLPLEEFCDRILEHRPPGGTDDIALLAVRLSPAAGEA
ncbi:SpoIIE family protein phosphatase [Microbispora sp. NPDC049125]|uniref:SpoIIE family protein phosphatase n=1 Tax=Microbispora sp. NPDC049125 TaxID=3154929 RepID=UPI0034656E49